MGVAEAETHARHGDADGDEDVEHDGGQQGREEVDVATPGHARATLYPPLHDEEAQLHVGVAARAALLARQLPVPHCNNK